MPKILYARSDNDFLLKFIESGMSFWDIVDLLNE